MALFDLIVVVDWSASAVPKLGRDSIWTCDLDATTGESRTVNHATRQLAAAHVRRLLIDAAERRVLVGCDFSYGYPAGLTAACGLGDGRPPWRAIWRHLCDAATDDAANRNNRFAVAAALNAAVGPGPGPFWGTTSDRHVAPTLSRTKAPGFPHRAGATTLAEHRITERRLRDAGRHPSSTWQLAGVGSVGSQSLTGIPVVAAWRDDPELAARSAVWPFETGLVADPTLGRPDAVVHAEVWPSGIDVDLARHPIKDAAQVMCLAEHLTALDAAGRLGALFAPHVDPAHEPSVVAEEGWILGA